MTAISADAWCDDVRGRWLWRASDLANVTFEVRAVTLLAFWFFLSRHADGRAYVVVRTTHHEDAGGRGG